jgi:hypothetical protein
MESLNKTQGELEATDAPAPVALAEPARSDSALQIP